MSEESEALLRIAWRHCWQISLLIPIIWLTTRLIARQRPHLAAILWLVVLIKCITPPLWSSPSSIFSWVQHQDSVNQQGPGPSIASRPTWWLSSSPEIVLGDGVTVQVDRSQPHPAEGVSTPSQASDEIRPQSTKNHGKWMRSCLELLCIIWVGGSLSFALFATARWFLLWRRICLGGEIHLPWVNELAAALCHQLGLRNRVRVVVTRNPVGPAVVGIFQPVVILPKLIVESTSQEQLKPLLAHELIHIRRGDLWIGLLQLLAQGVWWFHPFVRFANERMTRESERCCDEEVIACLGCDPGTYARCLINVMAMKKTLRSVPAFPGVRPVDVTSQRLERIMKLGQGCHRRTPRWCWLVMLLTVSATLPGAAFFVSGGEASTVPMAGSRSTSEVGANVSTKGTAEPVPAGTGAERITRTYPADDILKRMRVELNANESQARKILTEHLSRSAVPVASRSSHSRLVPPPGAVETVSDSGSVILTWDGDDVMVTGKAEEHAPVVQLLRAFRDYGFESILIETRVINGPMASAQKLSADWRVLDLGIPVDDLETRSDLGTTSLGVADEENVHIRGQSQSIVEKHYPALMALEDSASLLPFLNQAQSDPRTNLMFAPKVCVWNGQQATIQDSIHRPFVVGQKLENQKLVPVCRMYQEGWLLRVQPKLQKNNRVQLNLNLLLSEIRSVDSLTLPNSRQQMGLTVQIPEIASTKIRTDVDMQIGQTLLIGGLSIFDEQTKSRTPLMVLVDVKRLKKDDHPQVPSTRVKRLDSVNDPSVAAAVIQTSAQQSTTELKAELIPEDDQTVPERMEVKVYSVADLVTSIAETPSSVNRRGATRGNPQEKLAATQADPSDKAPIPSVPGIVEGAPQNTVDFEGLIELIYATISPDSWEVKGGSGSIRPIKKTLSIVVRQTAAIHFELANLLEQVRALQDLQVCLTLDRVMITPVDWYKWTTESRVSRECSTDLALMISKESAENLRKRNKNGNQPGTKVTLFNGQQTEFQFRPQDTHGDKGVTWLQLMPVASHDLNIVRMTVTAGLWENSPSPQKRSELVGVPRGESLLISLNEPAPRLSEELIPILQKVPYLSRLFVTQPASQGHSKGVTHRQFLLVTPRIFLNRDAEEAPLSETDRAARK